jgi:hypothetical protein
MRKVPSISGYATGVSNCHNIKSTVIKGEVLHEPKKLRYYRSYKTFDIENEQSTHHFWLWSSGSFGVIAM